VPRGDAGRVSWQWLAAALRRVVPSELMLLPAAALPPDPTKQLI
jgi:hypothetical protein